MQPIRPLLLLVALSACGLGGPGPGRSTITDRDVNAPTDRVLGNAVAAFRFHGIPVRSADSRQVDSGTFAVRGVWDTDMVDQRLECDRATAQSQLPSVPVEVRIRVLAVPRERLPDPDERDPVRRPNAFATTRLRLVGEAHVRGTGGESAADRCRLTGAFEGELLGTIIAGAVPGSD